jgi:O-antigen/teichoic acid export membrane protein
VSNQASTSRISRNALANLLAIGFVAVVSFFLSPFVVHQLGTEGFGVWSLVAGLLGYLGLLDFGIRQAVSRYVARFHAVAAHEEGSAFTSTAWTLFVVVAVAAFVLSVFLSMAMPHFFNIPAELLGDAQLIVVLGGVTVAMSLIVGLYGGIVSGLQRFDVQAVIEISITALRAGGTVLALNEGYGLVGLSAVHVAASVLNLLCYRFASRRLYRELRPALTTLRSARTRELLAFSSSTFIIMTLDTVAFYSDTVVIAVMMPVESIAFYAIASNVVSQARTLPSAFTYLLAPRISALSSQGSGEVTGQILLVGKFAALIVLPVVVSFIVRGETFLTLWMGPEIAERSAIVLAILALILWHGAGRSAVIQALTGLGLQHLVIPALAIEAVVNIALSVALVPSFGIVGVAFGTLLPSLIVSLVIIPRFLKRAAGVDLSDYYRVTVFWPAVASVPFALASYAIDLRWPPEGLLLFFLQIALVLPLVPATAWFLCLDDEERRGIARGVAGVLRRVRA